MRTQEISFSVPVIQIKFAQDAGKQLADEAKTIATDAATLIAQKQASFKNRMRQELVGPAHKMFGCHRSTLLQKREEVARFFNSQLETITNSIITITSNNVQDTDPNLIAAKARAEEIMSKRDAQLKQFDTAVETLDAAAQKAIDAFVS